MKYTVFLRVDNVQKKCKTSLTSWYVKKISGYFTDDLFKIIRQCLKRKSAGRLMEVKNHINNTLVTAKRWPRPLNRGGR